MDHGPAVKQEPDPASDYKSKVGLILFAVYALIYGGFIAVNTIMPKLMETKILFGLNLAIFYGFGLIVTAIVMGLIYNWMSTKKENEMSGSSKGAEK